MKFKIFNKLFFFNFIFVLIIFGLDRISKIYVINQFKKSYDNILYESKYLNIHLIWNEGIAFGLLSFQKENLYDILTVIILIVILVILFILTQNQGLKKYCYIMILGGALGNFFDRLFYKAVPDFIDFHVGNFHWFIFNLADIFISLGIFFLIILEFTDITKEKI